MPRTQSVNYYGCIKMHLHQSGSLPGTLPRFHESAGPPWFSLARRCALAELQPERQAALGT